MFKILLNILKRLDPKGLEDYAKTFYPMKVIEKLYQDHAKKDFVVYQQLVKVKKGKRKYYLAFIQTPKGQLKIWLSRNWDWNDIKTQLK